MNKLTPMALKKSYSLYQKKQASLPNNPEQVTHSNRQQSHIQELIFQKYNFISKLKNIPYHNHQWLKKYPTQKTSTLPATNVVVNMQLPSIQPIKTMNNKVQLFKNQKIQNNSKQNSLQICDYSFVQCQKRKFTDYKNSIKKVQMSTTYRAFNFRKQKNNTINRYLSQNQEQSIKNQDVNKTSERKRIIHYIIERGFAKKMEESLIKTRNQKKKIHDQTLSIKNTKQISPFKSKRSVVFTSTPTAGDDQNEKSKTLKGKQHPIQPW